MSDTPKAPSAPPGASPGDLQSITPWKIYLVYTKITLVGFGGTMFWIRRTFVDDLKWFSEAEFAEYLALGQLIPGGANLYNMALLIGHRFAGVRGAFAAGAGFISVPFFVMDPAKSPSGRNVVALKGGPGQGNFSGEFPAKVSIAVNAPAASLHFLGGVGGWAWPSGGEAAKGRPDRKSTRLNSSH